MNERRVQEWIAAKSLSELQQEADSAACGGVVCPGCGRKLFVNKTATGKTRIIRYEECRTPGCQRKFKTKQFHRVIVEEIKPKDISSAGKLTMAASQKGL